MATFAFSTEIVLVLVILLVTRVTIHWQLFLEIYLMATGTLGIFMLA